MPKPSAKSKQETLVAPADPAKRQDAAKNRRESRLKSYERNKRQWMITKISAAIIGLVIVAGIVYLIVDNARKEDLDPPDGVASYSYASGSHDDAFTAWTEVPPAGGTHSSTWQKCQYYAAPINPGMGVHSLEHGAVWITYSPDLAQDQIDKLKALADGQDFILVSPFSGLPAPIVATAWNKQLTLDSADDSKLEQFIKVFRNSPTNTPEYGATCSSGSTATVG